MKEDKIILGIDPGTVVMGYGVIRVKDGKLEPITLDVLKFNPKLDHYTRLERIFTQLTEVIGQYNPDEVALEAPFFGKNVQSMLKLGRAQGVAMAAALGRGIPVFEYSPRSIKQSIVGNGNASKEQVSGMLAAMFPGVEHKYYDASDALAVAACHYYQNKAGKPAHGESATKKASKAGQSKSWDAFIKANPERLK